MFSVIECVTGEHNLWLVLVAALVCVAGAWTILRLFRRACATSDAQSLGWLFLTAVAAGSAIWCTHFIAVLAYDQTANAVLDPVLTILSLLVAVGGAAPGLALAARFRSPVVRALGGAMLGLSIAAMHYTGMLAYRVQGLVTWDLHYLIASVVLSVVLSAPSLVFATRSHNMRDKTTAVAILVLAIVALHFTGMTAFHVYALQIPSGPSNAAALQALALAIAVVGLMIIGTGTASYLIDDRSRSDSKRQLHDMARIEPLTGLHTRAAFTGSLDRRIAEGQPFVLVLINLNRFKDINDLHGHSAGDDVLKTVAHRLTQLLAPGDTAARFGGDEFAILHGDGSGDLDAFLHAVETALFRPIRLGDGDVTTGAGIGIACYPKDGATRDILMNNADLAMFRAKSDMTRHICRYEPTMDEQARIRRTLAGDLRTAIANGQLEVHYQPQTAIATGKTTGFEALLRWRHPEHGYISPMEFIPLAEESGMILDIGEWVLRTACATAAAWSTPYKIAVNLSPVQFAHANLARLVHEVLIETGLSPRRLELELTESTFIADTARSLHTLRQIKALGVTIALDDFGTGYSSLETLRTFPFDKIKLDRSFMTEIEWSPQAKAIVRAVLALGKSLEVPVLAEGIESSVQLAILAAEGCDEAQGYFIGRPGPDALPNIPADNRKSA